MPEIRKPIFVRPLGLTGIASGNETAGHPASLLARHKSMGLTWRSSNASNVWARGQIEGGAKPIDFCAVLSANAVPGTSIRLRLGTSQAQVDGSAPYDSGAQTFINPAITREDGLYNSFHEVPSVQTASWWRIDITGHSGAFEAPVLVLGKKIVPTQFYNYDWEFGTEDLGALEIARNRVLDEQDGAVLRTIEFTLGWQTVAEFEESFRPMLERAGKRGMIYLCFDPSETAYRQNRTYYGIMQKAMVAKGHRNPRFFIQDFDFLSLI